MAELIAVLKKALWFTEEDSLMIDSTVFQLHNKVTIIVFVASSILVFTKQFFGSPIRCDAGYATKFVKTDVLDAYCWMYASFHVPPDFKGECTADVDEYHEGLIYNTYYQWIPVYLNILALCFMVPKLLWTHIEGGVMKYIRGGTEDTPKEKRDKLLKYYMGHIYGNYNRYHQGFLLCEFMNLCLVFLIVYMTDCFLKSRFMYYGIQVITYYASSEFNWQRSTLNENACFRNKTEYENDFYGGGFRGYIGDCPNSSIRMATNPMCRTFPRVASCDYHRFGPGGGTAGINALCILALNVINDKVFVLIWWWLMILALAGIGELVMQIAHVISFPLRFRSMKSILMSHRHPSTKAKEQATLILAETEKLKIFVSYISHGDWFVLYQMSKNLDHKFFVDFIVRLSTKINAKRFRGIPSFDLGVCEELMETKTGYDIHMHRNPSKGDRKTSLLNPFGPSRKNSVSKGLASTTYMNRLPSPKTPPIPEVTEVTEVTVVAEVTAPQTPVTYTDTLRLT